MNLQKRYDEARFRFCRDEVAAATVKLRTLPELAVAGSVIASAQTPDRFPEMRWKEI